VAVPSVSECRDDAAFRFSSGTPNITAFYSSASRRFYVAILEVFMLSNPRMYFIFGKTLAFVAVLTGLMFSIAVVSKAQSQAASPKTCGRIVYADIVAIEQAYEINRFSAFVPAGMLFALRSDVVPIEPKSALKAGNVRLREDKRPRPIVLRVNEGDCLQVKFTNYLAETVVEANADLLSRAHGGPLTDRVSVDMPATRAASFHIAGLELSLMRPEECPIGDACGGDGSNVNKQNLTFHPATTPETKASFDIGSLAKPNQTVVTRWQAGKDGAFFAYSMGAPVGGEGDGGQIGLGLFGAVNVEPAGSRWYRSQVTYDELRCAAGYQNSSGSKFDCKTTKDEVLRSEEKGSRHPYAQINFERLAQKEDGRADLPLLNLLDDGNNIVHSDLNAIIVPPTKPADLCKTNAFGSNCAKPYREFTVIFHDEVHAKQAFAELEDENDPLSLIKDGMGINYGVSSMGSLVLSTPRFGKDIWPVKKCPECRAEEFFLSSWANGDPALILDHDDKGIATRARYPDDPSNVHHSYLGDNVRFRNIHAGPKETHVFHLHAHQWVPDSADSNSSYLDSQTISPGATFSYDIEFGGSGNRNYTPGDSIFHCHLYPHFAQGMWELWRTHDAFVDGKPGAWSKATPRNQNLPDPEILEGTQTPAIVPMPNAVMAPIPSSVFPGYPHYIPGEKGHRPPQPVLDFDVDRGIVTNLSVEPDAKYVVDGGLPRHVVTGGTLAYANNSDPLVVKRVRSESLEKGGVAAQAIAERVAKQSPASLDALAGLWTTAEIKKLNWSGTDSEQLAMKYHEGKLKNTRDVMGHKIELKDGRLQPVELGAGEGPSPTWWNPKAYWTDFANSVSQQQPASGDPLFFVNGASREQGAPYANPCPTQAPTRDYRAAFIQTELTYNKHGWFDPQGRIAILENDIKDVIDADNRTKLPAPLFFRANSGECINFKSSNFVPSALNVDDFQVYTPTDTIGQHIHLVKFDVTSSDGSGNGFNYEDATFSPDEVIERIFAYNKTLGPNEKSKRLKPKAHPLFMKDGDIYKAAHPNGANGPIDMTSAYYQLWQKGICPDQGTKSDEIYQEELRTKHPYCGAQRTTQRWWADPILNTVNGRDNTLCTVFTHDHMGPSSHQQHGLYAGLVIEPANSIWTKLGPTPEMLAAGKPQLKNEYLQDLDKCSLETSSAAKPSWCSYLLGGSNLSHQANFSARESTLLSAIQPRQPLKLRADGGPTSTMANIFAPDCIGDSDSNPLQPQNPRSTTFNNVDARTPCPSHKLTHNTRREFDLAIADFGIAYNTALEPINPEPLGDSMLRDTSMIRFGQRHVMDTPARPLAISSEDPGGQFFNYRNEPLALRISEATPDPVRGGFNYAQSDKRAILDRDCKPGEANCTSPKAMTCSYENGDQDCLGDTANGFSTGFHARRDERLAKLPQLAYASAATTQLTEPAKLASALKKAEQWRKNFNCALYSEKLMGVNEGCNSKLVRDEPWRQFGDPATPILPAFEGDRAQIRLIQGAQEAQHIFTMNGVKWHRLPGDGDAGKGNNSGYVNAQPVGISEHFEFDIVATPLDNKLTDYMYYGSSTDQLWDGLWGIMRVFDLPDPKKMTESAKPVEVVTSVSASDNAKPTVKIEPQTFLNTLPDSIVSQLSDNKNDPCSIKYSDPKNSLPEKYFEVSAVRYCDLHASCDNGTPGGLVYNEHYNIIDDNAVVYVQNSSETTCYQQGEESKNCPKLNEEWQKKSNAAALADLRTEFKHGRILEPLVLRAAADQCIHVRLRNLLPRLLADGPVNASGNNLKDGKESESYYNFLPMITDGFNINDYRMSSSVGLSPTRVAMHVTNADGSNVGLNGAVASYADDVAQTPYLKTGQEIFTQRQGSLVPPCKSSSDGGLDDDFCKSQTYEWSATDFEGVGANYNKATEFGAIPLRSFGDPMKHAGHGLAGALIIGPVGSKVCDVDRFAKVISVPDANGVGHDRKISSASAEICNRDGTRYVDHVLIVQDSVFAKRGGFPLPNLAGAEEPDDYGVKGLNYKTEPLWARTANDPAVNFSDRNEQDMSKMMKQDSETPVLTSKVGEKVRIHLVHPGGHTRQQGIAISGHAWNPYPWTENSHALAENAGSSIRQGIYNGFGPMMGITLSVTAGGAGLVAMDYLIRSQSSFLFDGGIWATLRVEQ
jgi:manganese oxidase